MGFFSGYEVSGRQITVGARTQYPLSAGVVQAPIQLLPPVWNGPPAQDPITQSGTFPTASYVSGGTPPYTFSIDPIRSTVQEITLNTGGITLNHSTGVFTASAGATLVPYPNIVMNATDSNNLVGISTPFTLTVVPQNQISIPAGEMFAFWKIIPPPTGRTIISWQLASGSGPLPPGSFLGDGITPNAKQSGIFFAFAPSSSYESLCSTGTFSGILIQGNLDVAGGGGSVVGGPYTINVTAALPAGFSIIRGGNTVATYNKLISATNNQQDGDIISVLPRTYYCPDQTSYTLLIKASHTIKSAIAGQRFTIDGSDARFHGLVPDCHNLLQINAFTYANQANCTNVFTDFALIGANQGPDASPTEALLYVKGPNAGGANGVSVHITVNNCSFSNGYTGLTVDGPSTSCLTYNTDTTSVTLNSCEFSGNGGGTGPNHNWYINKIGGEFKATGCYSHSLLPYGGNDGHLAKSYASKTTYIACRFTSENGAESFLCDFGSAGDVTVQGCIFQKNTTGGNDQLISVGRQSQFLPTTDGRILSFKCYQNTFANYDTNGVFFDYGKNPDNTVLVLAANDIQDNIVAGPQSQGLTTSGNSVAISPYAGGYLATTIPSNNSYVTNSVSSFPSVFTDPGNYNFSLVGTPIQATGTESPATLAYTFRVGTVSRSDFNRGAYTSGLPSWATLSAIPSGTWVEVGSNTIQSVVNPATLWNGFSGSSRRYSFNFSGAAYSKDYGSSGGILYHGQGHASEPGQLSNVVVAWNTATGSFERAVNEFYGNDKLFGGTVSWTFQDGHPFWRPDGTQQPYDQADTTADPLGPLGRFQELAFRHDGAGGVIAANHSYGQMWCFPKEFTPGFTSGVLFCPVASSPHNFGGSTNSCAHFCDLSGGPQADPQDKWYRFSNEINTDFGAVGNFGAGAYDERRGVGLLALTGHDSNKPMGVYNFAARTRARFPMNFNRDDQYVSGQDSGLVWVPGTDPTNDIYVNKHPADAYITIVSAAQIAVNDSSIGWKRIFPNNWIASDAGASFSQGGNVGGVYGGLFYIPELNTVCVLDFASSTGPRLCKLVVPLNPFSGTWTWSYEVLSGISPVTWDSQTWNRVQWDKQAKVILLPQIGGRMRAFRPLGVVS